MAGGFGAEPGVQEVEGLRSVLAVLSLLIAAFSVGTDIYRPTAESALCRRGYCRFDQVFASMDAQGVQAANLSALLNEDPANPLVWCTYGEFLAKSGDAGKATAVFDHAMSLGPDMPPALMRGVNFYFNHGQPAKALPLAGRILAETSVFDGAIFSDFRAARLPVSTLLGTGVPNIARAARAWLDWLRDNGSDADLSETWVWMQRNRLLDQRSAVNAVSTLWSRKSFRTAQNLWLSWIGPDHGNYPEPEELWNTAFQDQPAGGPFDWTLDPPPSVTLSRKDGLEVRFSGTDNVAFSGVRQGAVVRPGRYRFIAEIEAAGLTTDQNPFFHIFDPTNPGTVHVESQPFRGTVPRSRITLELSVPASTRALMVQLERRPSERFDNKIEGTLHVYQVSFRMIERY
jgi:hypothetical protein